MGNNPRLAFQFSMPYCLYIADGYYQCTLPEYGTSEPALVILEKYRRDPSKIDYRTFWQAEAVGRGELWNDPKGTFRRTKITIIFPGSQTFMSFDPTADTYADHSEQIVEMAVATANRLVSAYRYVTGDAYLPLVHAEDINNWTWLGKCVIEHGVMVSSIGRETGFDARLTNTITDYESNLVEEVRAILTRGDPIPLFESFLQNARLRLSSNEWNVAVIEAQTGFEVYVIGAVRDHYLKGGRVQSDIDRICQAGFQNLVLVHLPKAANKVFGRGTTEYDDWQSKTYQLRNEIVHSGKSADAQTSHDAVLAVEHAIEHLTGRSCQRYWPKNKPTTHVNEFIA